MNFTQIGGFYGDLKTWELEVRRNMQVKNSDPALSYSNSTKASNRMSIFFNIKILKMRMPNTLPSPYRNPT